MQPIIDHIQITVQDLDSAEIFYDKLLPLLGFDLNRKIRSADPEHDYRVVEYLHPLLLFAITSPREAFRNESVHRRKPGSLHHLAFRAESPEEVDRLYPLIMNTGTIFVTEPRHYPQYGDKYYSLFFKDPQNIKYEIVYDER